MAANDLPYERTLQIDDEYVVNMLTYQQQIIRTGNARSADTQCCLLGRSILRDCLITRAQAPFTYYHFPTHRGGHGRGADFRDKMLSSKNTANKV